jgi:Domain of unknown function (DUF4340)
MKKNIVYIVLLVFVAFGVWYFMFYKNSDALYETDEAKFTIKDTASIGRIFIASNDGQSVLVERTDSGWILNKKQRALRSTLNMMLNTFLQQEALCPVAKNAQDNAIRQLSTLSTKVEVYDRKGKVITKFYVGGDAPNGTGTIMMTEGAKRPFVVQVRNFVGTLTSRYSSAPLDWRDRTVFNMAADEIAEISIQYSKSPENSFVLTKDGEKITVEAAAIKGQQKELNEHNAKVYCSYFYNVNCEGYLNGAPRLDSTMRDCPQQSVIELKNRNGKVQRAEIYYMPVNRRSKNLTMADKDVPDDYDADRLIAVINNRADTVMIQRFVFGKIFHKGTDFFLKGDVPLP